MQMKAETLKVYRVILAFDQRMIPMVRWIFNRVEFRLNPNNLLGPHPAVRWIRVNLLGPQSPNQL
jgi:hypothetical protein